MLLRLAYLGITNAFALLRLLPRTDREKDAEILALRHQLAVLQRHLDGQRIRVNPADRAWLAALLHPLPRAALDHLRLLVPPDTILRWHRNVLTRRHAAASRPRRRGRPRTVRSIRRLVLPGSGQPVMGVSPRARRTTHPWHHGRRIHRLGNAARGRHPLGPGPGHHHLGAVPPLPGRRAARGGLHRDDHADRREDVPPRGHRTRQPPRPDPRHSAPPRIRPPRGWPRPPATS